MKISNTIVFITEVKLSEGRNNWSFGERGPSFFGTDKHTTFIIPLSCAQLRNQKNCFSK